MLDEPKAITILQKELRKALSSLDGKGVSFLFSSLVADVEYLTLYAIHRSQVNRKFKVDNWPLLFRNMAIDLETKSPLKDNLYGAYLSYEMASVTPKEYLESFYSLHLQPKCLNQKKFALRYIIHLTSLLLANMNLAISSFPIAHLKEMIIFNYELEIKSNLILRKNGLLPSPEDILEDFKRRL